METTETQITLATLPIGARLIYRAKKDLREAVVSQISAEKVTLIVCSASGHTYRVRKNADEILQFVGAIPFLIETIERTWREDLVKYDVRW